MAGSRIHLGENSGCTQLPEASRNVNKQRRPEMFLCTTDAEVAKLRSFPASCLSLRRAKFAAAEQHSSKAKASEHHR